MTERELKEAQRMPLEPGDRCKCQHLRRNHDDNRACTLGVWGMPDGCDCEEFREVENESM